MKYLANILYFDTKDMEAIGVSKKSLVDAKDKSFKSYTIIKDPADLRRILVEYDSLKPALQLKAQQWLGECPHQWYAKKWIKSHIQPNAEAFRFFQTYKIEGEDLSTEDIYSYYTAVQWLIMIRDLFANKTVLKSNNCSIAQFWDIVCNLIRTEGIRLPNNYSRLLEKLKSFKNIGCKAVIKEGNYRRFNAAKINDDVADWLVAKYSLPNKIDIVSLHEEYNSIAFKHGWKPIKDANSIYKFLHQPEIKQLWYGAREGFLLAKEKYGYTLRTKLPTLRDSLWYSDGTKLNFFDATGKLKASYVVYEVIDVYSEVFLGFHISKTEDHVAQYHAYKMAMNFSGQKPYEIRTDNQGGHKKIGAFLDKLAHVNIRTQPHNGKSKTIESMFGRFQDKFMKKLWYFTGQNITAKKQSSRANMEFICANLKHLPDEKQVMAAYIECRNQWNNAPHPKYKQPRIDLYRSSHNPKATPIDYLDMIELFWLESKSPITYYTHGITITLSKQAYEYEVLKDGMPDVAFRSKHIDRKFIVKYDPDNMDHIRLYLPTEKGLQFVAIAEPRLVVHRALQDHVPGEAQFLKSLLDVRKSGFKQDKQQAAERELRTGISRAKMIEEAASFGNYQKALSMANANDWDGEFEDNSEDMDIFNKI